MKITKETLDTIVRTRWSSVSDCLQSFNLLRGPMEMVINVEKSTLPAKIVNIINNRFFFVDIDNLHKVMKPLAYAMSLIQSRSCTMADCYLILAYLHLVTNEYAVSTDARMFGRYVSKVANIRLNEFKNDLYLCAFYLHPKYRGAGMLTTTRSAAYRCIAEYSKKIGSNMAMTKNVISALQRYEIQSGPYALRYSQGKEILMLTIVVDFSFIGDTPTSWWSMIRDETHNNCLQKIALRLLSITPHSVMPERLFSVLDWQHSKRRNRLSPFTLENIAKIHTYYNNESIIDEPIDLTYMEEALADDLQVPSRAEDSGSATDTTTDFFHAMSSNHQALLNKSDSQNIDDQEPINENDLLQLDDAFNTQDRAFQSILIDIGLMDATESYNNVNEQASVEDSIEIEPYDNEDYDVEELLKATTVL
jgi:hypothetical protein